MKFRKYTLIYAGFLASLGQAASTTRTTITFSTQLCLTSQGTNKVSPIPRTTTATTIHSHVSATETITPTSTVTPTTSTSTSTVTSTVFTTSTLSTVTKSFTSTSTTTSTITANSIETDTATATYISTNTVNIDSTTIPEAAGFTPVASEPAVIAAGGSSSTSKHRRSHKRNASVPQDGQYKIMPPPLRRPAAAGVNAATPKSSYPTQINCSRTVTLVTMTISYATAASTTTTLTANTTTVFTTTISTSTIYSTPADVSTTTVETSTSFTTSTAVSTTTTTSTSTTVTTTYIAAATTYAVCQDPANFVKSVNGHLVYYIDQGDNTNSVVVTAQSNYECCAACASQPNCVFSAFSDYASYCNLLFGEDTCDPTEVYGYFQTTPNNNGYFIVSNQNCGQVDYLSGA